MLKVSNVIWCTGFTPNYDWIDFSLPAHNGIPIHDRGIVESCPGLYFVGLPFLYSLSSALLGGVGREPNTSSLTLFPRGCQEGTTPWPEREPLSRSPYG